MPRRAPAGRAERRRRGIDAARQPRGLASSTMRLILSMLSFRTGHVLSVATHCASVMPHVQVQRARFAASSALLFSFGLSIEKSTTTMSRSVYAMLDIWDTPYTTSATAPAVTIHFTGLGSRTTCLRSCLEREAFFTN